MSISWQLDAEPRPAILVLPPGAASLDEAEAAIELWEHYRRRKLDPTQRLAVQVMMAQDSAGMWAARTTGREMPRQNGKGDEIEVVELWGLVQRAEAILHTVHDAVLLATQTQQRMLAALDHKDLRSKVRRVWTGTGQQMIEMANGGTIWYRTRTNGGARGVDDVSRLVVDESQHATSEHMEAVSPTLLANADPQLNACGTAALGARSEWWWMMRCRALSAAPGAFGYVGHTAERVSLDEAGRPVQLPVDVEDRGLWRSANPAVAAGRGSGMEFLEEQFKRLGPEGFAREHLCVWDPMPSSERAGHMAEYWSEWWWMMRCRALSAAPGAFGYIGHTAERVSLDGAGRPVQLPVDVEDRDLWRSANPVVAAGRGGGMEFLEEQFQRLGPEGFAREHLCVWDPMPSSERAGHMAEYWSATRIEFAPEMHPGAVRLGWAVDAAGASASIAVAVGSAHVPYVELVDHRKGVGWLPERLAELVQRWSPPAVGHNNAGATAAQVGAVLEALVSEGVDASIMEPLPGARWAAACGAVDVAAREGRLSRHAEQPPLDLAGDRAGVRLIGDGSAWDARSASVPVSPLEAITAAVAVLPQPAVEEAAPKPVFAW